MEYNPSKLWVDVTGRVECLGGLVTVLELTLKNITEPRVRGLITINAGALV